MKLRMQKGKRIEDRKQKRVEKKSFHQLWFVENVVDHSKIRICKRKSFDNVTWFTAHCKNVQKKSRVFWVFGVQQCNFRLDKNSIERGKFGLKTAKLQYTYNTIHLYNVCRSVWSATNNNAQIKVWHAAARINVSSMWLSPQRNTGVQLSN